jgi:hypothetical protein
MAGPGGCASEKVIFRPDTGTTVRFPNPKFNVGAWRPRENADASARLTL